VKACERTGDSLQSHSTRLWLGLCFRVQLHQRRATERASLTSLKVLGPTHLYARPPGCEPEPGRAGCELKAGPQVTSASLHRIPQYTQSQVV